MKDGDIRLPTNSKPGPKGTKSQASMFERKGRVELGNEGAEVLPISMDAEAMEELIKELMLRENEERLESQMSAVDESTRLPSPSPMLASTNVPPQ